MDDLHRLERIQYVSRNEVNYSDRKIIYEYPFCYGI